MDILITVIVIAAVALLWVMLYDSNRFTVKYHTVEDERIQKACRAVLVTDLHNKRYGKDNEILLAAIREQGPDFILMPATCLRRSRAPLWNRPCSFCGRLPENIRSIMQTGIMSIA